jgi:GNAT superfamily N-acetyltransferase
VVWDAFEPVNGARETFARRPAAGRQDVATGRHSELGTPLTLTSGVRRSTSTAGRVAAMTETGFATVAELERDRAICTLLSAFENDPVERWLYPDDAEYRAHFPAFIAAFGGGAFRDQTVWRLGDFEAIAFWFGPGREPDGEAVARILVETTSRVVHADSLATLEQMAGGHPTEPYWYLPWFGVARGLQGHGLGTHLMCHCLELVDASGVPAYLETPNPRRIPFYERAGFTITGVAQAGTCPPITLMQRTARKT